jgi:MoaA/NifB/PqqE/SkfB family radical SAM enzyme
MSTQEVLNLIDEMSEAGVRKLSLWGGEPLLRDDIGIIISQAKEKGMCVNIDSNGYLIPEKFEQIKDLDFIILSFDGEKELHDKNREPGSYDKFFHAVEFIDRRIPVWTLTVLTKNNMHSFDFIIEKAQEYGFKTLFQVPYHSYPLGLSVDILAKPEEYRKVFGQLARLKKKGAPIISSTRYLNAVAEWSFFSQTTSKSRPKNFPACWAGRLFCNIDTNGDMYPCSPMIGSDSRPPNVLKDGFVKSFRRLLRPNCQSCLSACSLESNFVFSFDRKSIIEWMGVL